MIDQVDARLSEWVKGLLDGVDISLLPPKASPTGRGVGLYLLEIRNRPAPRNNTPAPFQIQLRYLVTTWASDPEVMHQLLGRLIFEALTIPEFEVDLEPLSPSIWAAFGIPPQPSFILVVPLRQERPEPATKLVRKPLVLKTSPIITLRGVILGPDDTPMPNARVELPTLQLYTLTDSKGRFSLAGVPGEPRKKMLHIRARGKELDVSVEPSGSANDPVVIRFNLFD